MIPKPGNRSCDFADLAPQPEPLGEAQRALPYTARLIADASFGLMVCRSMECSEVKGAVQELDVAVREVRSAILVAARHVAALLRKAGFNPDRAIAESW